MSNGMDERRKGFEGKIELYDLQKDEKETTDVSAKYPKIVARIAEIMKREHVESENWSDSKAENQNP